MSLDQSNENTKNHQISSQSVIPSRSGMDENCPVTIDFDVIAEGSNKLIVTFRGQHYQLRTTRNGKLILNK